MGRLEQLELEKPWGAIGPVGCSAAVLRYVHVRTKVPRSLSPLPSRHQEPPFLPRTLSLLEDRQAGPSGCIQLSVFRSYRSPPSRGGCRSNGGYVPRSRATDSSLSNSLLKDGRDAPPDVPPTIPSLTLLKTGTPNWPLRWACRGQTGGNYRGLLWPMRAKVW